MPVLSKPMEVNIVKCGVSLPTLFSNEDSFMQTKTHTHTHTCIYMYNYTVSTPCQHKLFLQL